MNRRLPSPIGHVPTLAWALVAVILALDLVLPAGPSVRLLYLGVVLVGLWGPDRWLALKVAAVASVLSVAHLASGSEGPRTVRAVLSESTILHGVWVAAIGVTLHRRGTHQKDVAQRRLAASLKELEDVRNALDQSAIVATTDVHGTITSVNDKFCEISQYSREELVGRNHRIVNSGLHPPEFFQQMYRTIGSGRVWHGEIRNRAKDGTFYWVDTTIVPFLDSRGKPYQYVAIRYDITERKQTEAALRQQAALTQLGRMAAVVAHEVRNPLAGIRGAVQVMGRRLPAGSSEAAVVAEIVSRIDTLDDIVQDLLLFARPRPLTLTPVNVRQLIDDVLGLLREDPRAAGIDLETTASDETIVVDRELIKLLLLNLVINGIQAMSPPGTVRVEAHAVGDAFEIVVADEGPGIPENVREQVFEPFFTTKSRGTGLGLATARRIAESHGGTLALECPPGGGTRAVVRLPRAAGLMPAAGAAT